MTNFKKTAIVSLLAGMGFSGASHASLLARAGGMVYDDVNKITWAADANLFKTQATGNANLINEIIAGNGGVIHDTPNIYDNGTYKLTGADFNTNTGTMTWWGAQAWANNLTLGSVKGWSLPSTPIVVGGKNVTSSQLGDLFYNQLGGAAYASITTTHNANYNLFTNVQSYVYWSSQYPIDQEASWVLATASGDQGAEPKIGQLYAWAVHPGDVANDPAAVPVPGAVWLFGSGLIGLLSFTRRKNKTANLITA